MSATRRWPCPARCRILDGRSRTPVTAAAGGGSGDCRSNGHYDNSSTSACALLCVCPKYAARNALHTHPHPGASFGHARLNGFSIPSCSGAAPRPCGSKCTAHDRSCPNGTRAIIGDFRAPRHVGAHNSQQATALKTQQTPALLRELRHLPLSQYRPFPIYPRIYPTTFNDMSMLTVFDFFT